jgi:DNA repair protein RecN (Recombination protein N)
MVRSGAETAYVEGIFTLPPAYQEALAPLLTGEGVEGNDPTTLLLAREVRVNGRNICRVNGRAVTLSFMTEVSENMVDIHGQGEHLSLLRPRAHLPLLDAYAGLEAERRTLAREVSQLRKVEAELVALKRDARNIAQRIDMLEFQVREIDAANLAEGEEEEVRAGRGAAVAARRGRRDAGCRGPVKPGRASGGPAGTPGRDESALAGAPAGAGV